MILVATGETTSQTVQQAAIFADQLKAAGFDPVIDPATLPEDTNLAIKMHVLPYLRKPQHMDLTHVMVIGADATDPQSLNRLRRLDLGPDVKVMGFGRFETTQDEISSTSKLAYVTGQHPQMFDLRTLPQIVAGKSICPCFGVAIETSEMPHLRGRPSVTVIAPEFEDPEASRPLQALTTTQAFNTLILLSGKDKTEWIRQYGPGGHVYGISEISPTLMSAMSDILVLTGPIGNNHNALCLLNNHTVSGSAIIDASPDASFQKAGYPVHRGPIDLGYISHFLRETILPNMDGITEAARGSKLAAQISLTSALEEAAPTPAPKAKAGPQERRVHFMPTNGNGLGHAQRCVLIAQALKAQKTDSAFFAYPSCLPMINKAGFEATPLVSRSELHSNSGNNDLVNYPRLCGHMSPNDVFVFDGGYVFDSIYRAVLDRSLNSVWIRRGLWPSEQDNRIPLDREKYFARVIEPAEAFDTLNHTISGGTHIKKTGPIVRQVTADDESRAALHKALKNQFGLSFDKLVVTMLGSGMFHNLSANVQTVCNMIERREDYLNLILVWPSAVVPSQRYAWQRSKVVKSIQASWLAAHAHFVVSAAGYNSFHESMYNGVPTIFVPQSAQVLDDQTARAEAAADLGLAAHIPAAKLSQLDRELHRFADEGRADEIRQALQAHAFPETGNARAAKLIREMTQ